MTPPLGGLTEISGDRYLCTGCMRRVPGTSTPPTPVFVDCIVAIFVDKSWVPYDQYWLKQQPDLSKLGSVVTLR